MTFRLVWNFELTATPLMIIPSPIKVEKPSLRWEARYFWPEKKIICLNGLDPSFLNLGQCIFKQRLDTYILVPNITHNIKRRNQNVILKPVIEQGKNTIGFGKKTIINQANDLIDILRCPLPSKKKFAQNTETVYQMLTEIGLPIDVEKNILQYTLNTKPATRLELSRLIINHKVYWSVSIESRAKSTVEALAKQILPRQKSTDYVAFLNTIIQEKK